MTLSESVQWKRLLHFEQDQSYIDDPDFFLSKTGHQDSYKELVATVDALRQDQQIACSYPARSMWLAERIPELSTVSLDNCSEYQTWRRNVNADTVTLVFAGSYLNSPSSMYGHTFFRFDPPDRGKGELYLSYAVNFGAVVEHSDNSILYAYQGILGGYPGYFSDGPYYEKIKEYSRLDNRDLWEYQLNLTPSEVGFLIAHLWELKDTRFDYYFFDENCSFRLLEMLEVARPEVTLTKGFELWAIPVDTVSVVVDAGMVQSVEHRPSNKQVLQGRLTLLTDEEQDLVAELVVSDLAIESESYQELPVKRRYQVAEASYKLLRYRVNSDQRSDQVASRSHRLLSEMHALSEHAELVDIPAPVRPETGHDTASLQLAVGYQDNKAYVSFGFRPSYHDLLDNSEAYPGGLSLNIGKAEVRAVENEGLRIQNFDVIQITSLPARGRFFDPLSWNVRAGVERAWTRGDDPMTGHITGGVGGTWQLTNSINVFAMGQMRAEYNQAFQHKAEPGVGFFSGLYHQSNVGSFMLDGQGYHFTGGLARTQLAARYQIPLTTNHGLRLSLIRDESNGDNAMSYEAAYRHYF